MSHELGSTLDVAIVELIVEESIDSYHHRLLHLVRHHRTYHRLHFSERREKSTSENLEAGEDDSLGFYIDGLLILAQWI